MHAFGGCGTLTLPSKKWIFYRGRLGKLPPLKIATSYRHYFIIC